MRMQAALVVAAGVFIVFAMIVFSGLLGELERLPSEALTEEQQDQEAFLEIFLFCWCVSCVALVGFWIALFLRVSRRKYRVQYHTPPSGNPLQLFLRVRRRMGPIQFSILTMLALMLAVALVCSYCATMMRNLPKQQGQAKPAPSRAEL